MSEEVCAGGCSVGCALEVGAGAVTVWFTADDRAPDALGEGNNSGPVFTELRPMEYPMPKKMAQRITSPKNRASILPVPRVISVSVVSSMRVAATGLMMVFTGFSLADEFQICEISA